MFPILRTRRRSARRARVDATAARGGEWFGRRWWRAGARWRPTVGSPRTRWAIRCALSAALAAALAYFPYRLLDGSGARRAEALRRDTERVRDQARALEAENLALRREIDALKRDPAAVEDIARDELGMVRPGEIVIRLHGRAARGDTP